MKSNVSYYHTCRYFICLFGLFEKGSLCVTKIGLEYTGILLPQSPMLRYRCAPLHLPSMFHLFSQGLIIEGSTVTLSYPERVYNHLEKE